MKGLLELLKQTDLQTLNVLTLLALPALRLVTLLEQLHYWFTNN